MTRASYLASHWANGPRIPVPGDVDGDGRGDLVSIYREGDGVIDVQLTVKWGKPTYGVQARRGFGRDVVAGAIGRFEGSPGMSVVAVSGDGSVTLAWGMAKGGREFAHADPAGKVPPELVPKAPARAFAADVDGDGKPDAILLGADGKTSWLRNKGDRTFVAKPLGFDLAGYQQAAAGSTGAEPGAFLWWLDGKGGVWRGKLGGKPEKVGTATGDIGLAVGRFRGLKRADVLVGNRLWPGGEEAKAVPMPDVPASAFGDLPWLVCDFDGNGKDDLFRMRATSAPFIGEDRFIHFGFDGKDPYKGYLCSAEDGLPDAWKTGQMKPNGLDLKALGCKVGRRDLVLEVQGFTETTDQELRNEFDQVAKYFASLPVKNPDGSTGIAVHTLFQPPLPMSAKAGIGNDFDATHPMPAHRGMLHWLQVEKGFNGVAQIWGIRGRINDTWQNAIHELGHNFGLIHKGYQRWPYSPVYGSIMSYSYSYGFDDDPAEARYSPGVFKDHPLDERHLSEVLPFPMEKVHYLAGRPYHFRLKPGADPNTTLIDWNWNGVFGETDVAADINYEAGRFTSGMADVGRANSTPVLLDAGGKLTLLSGYRDSGGEPLSLREPGKLTLKTWSGDDWRKWSDEVAVETQATGDASAAWCDGAIWTACPTPGGISLRRVSGDGKVSEPYVVPATVGAVPTLAVHGGVLRMFVWRDAAKPVGVRDVYTDRDKPVAKFETSIEGLFSLYPVGAASGGGSLWIATLKKNPQGAPQWRLARVGDDLKVKSDEWSVGASAGRLQVLWEAAKGFKATGQAILFARGGTDAFGDIWSGSRTGYRDSGGGWRQVRYDLGGIQSRSAPGVCFFGGDIAMATWKSDGGLSMVFQARGVLEQPIQDFDDISHIAHVGLQQSINTMDLLP